jgi:hypothetical protein
LHERQLYAAFEEAVTAYGKEVIEAITAETLSSQLGGSAGGSAVNQTIFRPSLQNVIATSAQYGTEAGVGGPVTLRTAMIDLVGGQQDYNLTSLIGQGAIEIRKVFYEAPPAIMRYFDPYAGTGTGIQSLMDAFDFGSFSPGVNFLLMPASYDVLKTQAIEFNDQIRKSHYTFEIHGDDIKFWPIPTSGTGSQSSTIFYGQVWFEYILEEDKNNDAVLFGNTALLKSVVSDASNIPYTYQTYSSINDMGRAWIIKYGAALAKEMLGFVRGKYSSVPIPNAEVTLNGSELVTQGQSEKDTLITQLREFLDKMTREAMITRQNAESTQMNEILGRVPLKIYVG